MQGAPPPRRARCAPPRGSFAGARPAGRFPLLAPAPNQFSFLFDGIRNRGACLPACVACLLACLIPRRGRLGFGDWPKPRRRRGASAGRVLRRAVRGSPGGSACGRARGTCDRQSHFSRCGWVGREIRHDLDRLGSGSRYTFASLVVLARESLMCVGGVRDAEKGRARGVRRVW